MFYVEHTFLATSLSALVDVYYVVGFQKQISKPLTV